MKKRRVATEDCKIGDILARDYYNGFGAALIRENAVITGYIKRMLIENGIIQVEVYYKTVEDIDFIIRKNYLNNVTEIKGILNDLSAGKKLNYDKVLNVSEAVYFGVDVGYHTIRVLAQVQGIDNYTYTHSINTAFYSMLIGKWLGLPESEIKRVIQCGLLHDIGKVKVPSEVLNKRGVLTREEFEVMKKHTILGFAMLDDIDCFDSRIRKAVLLHHERTDRSGYPLNASPDCVGLYSRILAVADVYDSMTSDRVYKERVTPFDAFEMFKTVGLGLFDIKIINVFLNNIATYYTGVKVLLTNGEQGEIVYVPPQDILYPIVFTGKEYLDLAMYSGLKIKKIIRDSDNLAINRIIENTDNRQGLRQHALV